FTKSPDRITTPASDATPPQAATARKSRGGLLAAMVSHSAPAVVHGALTSPFDKVSCMDPSPPSRSNHFEEAGKNTRTFETPGYDHRVWRMPACEIKPRNFIF